MHDAGTDTVNTANDVDSHQERILVRGGAARSPGGGLMGRVTAPKTTTVITRDFIGKQSPGLAFGQLLQNVPGINSASIDPTGMQRDSLTMRGLSQAEIGYLFAGVPVANPLNSSVSTSAIIDSENIGSLIVSQGSPDLASPLTNGVGGQISVNLLQPKLKRGGAVDYTFGSDQYNRGFLRYDTGEIGNSGVTGFASFSEGTGKNWTGGGRFRRYHVDSALKKEWGSANSAELIFTYNWQKVNYMRPVTLAQWNAYGSTYNYPTTYAPKAFINGFSQGPSWVGTQIYQRQNFTAIAPVQLTLADHLKASVRPYFSKQIYNQVNEESLANDAVFYGQQAQPTQNFPNAILGTSDNSYVDLETDTTGGLVTSLDYTRRTNSISIGYWYQYNMHEELNRLAPLSASGLPASMWNGPWLRYTTGRYAGLPVSGFDIHMPQQVNGIYLADKLTLLGGRLVVNAGLKEVMTTRTAQNEIPADNVIGGASTLQSLPELSASYQITPHNQVYMNATTGFRAPGSYTAYINYYDPASKDPAGQPFGALKDEYAISEELGYRHTGLINLDLSAFNMNMTNHQVYQTLLVNGTMQTSFLNAGGETIRGFQGALGLTPWHHFSPFLSAVYINATNDNDIRAGSDLLPTAGKQSVLVPRWSGSVGLTWTYGGAFVQMTAKYNGSEFSTFMNNQKLPAYAIGNINVGYTFGNVSLLHNLAAQLNITNFTNEKYLAGVSGLAGSATDVTGRWGTKINAGSPSYSVGAPFSMMASVSAGF